MTSAMGRDIASATSNGAPSYSGGQLQQAATGLMDQAARTADAQASTRMTMAGDTLDAIARAIDEASERLRSQQPDLANLTTTAAERVQDAATYLRDHTASEALQGVQQYARRQPAVVVGGGLLLGLVLGRFLRTGATVAQGAASRDVERGYGASASTSYDDGTGPGIGSDYASAYGTDTSAELAGTDAAAGRLDVDAAPMASDVVVTEVDGEPVGDLGDTSRTRVSTGEGR